MSSETNVLCGFDDGYAPQFATMLSSLFASCRNPEQIKVHLISNVLSPAARLRLDQIFARYQVGKIHWLEVDCSPFANAPVTMHFTRAMYSRIAAFNVLPAERVLYLDADLLCLADVTELYDSNLAGRSVGAILDPAMTFGAAQHKLDLGLSLDALCFNSGVLLVDLAQWQSGRLTETCIHYLERKKPVIVWPDQDVLNAVLDGKWLKLPSQWNAQTHFWNPVFRDCLAATLPDELDVTAAPKIVHFTDPEKPWHFGYQHPYRDLYFEHLSRSGWPHAIRVASQNGVSDVVVNFELERGPAT